MANVRQMRRRVFAALFAVCVPFVASAQYVGRNINMVSGTTWPNGDPFLQRQNEGSFAASTRNPLRLVGGANDYRTVDLPGLPDGEETGDASLGLFKSLDGGLTWTSGLVPGYPQDTSADGLATPVRQVVNGIKFTAAADPMVRSGLNGMFYYSGIHLTREQFPVSAVIVARFNDFNDREYKDPIHYIGMSAVADGRPGKTSATSSKFYDKPSLAVDLPRAGAQVCSVAGQSFLGGNVYVVYTVIESHLDGTTVVTDSAKLFFSRSTDCAATWSTPVLISGNHTLNQGSVMTIDMRSGALYVVWRRIARGTETNALLVTKSSDLGKTFSAPVIIRDITPFEQGTTSLSFRAPAYPTAVTDADGRLYVAWAERSGPAGALPGTELPDGRIMMANSPDGLSWSPAVMVSPTAPVSPISGRGTQFMPALSYASGKLMLVHYDLREDSTIGQYVWSKANPFFTETRQLVGDLAANNPNNVFNNFVQDAGVFGQLLRRHTLDLRVTQASPGALPIFAPSQRVSAYRFGYTTSDPKIRQLEFNPPNLKMFKLGTVPFFGDYVDLAPQYPFVSSLINLPLPAPVFHAVWTDNRDVKPPADGDWTKYTAPFSASNSGISKIDGSALTPCDATHSDRAGMRNQNLYTARITAGLFFGSPGNDKPLGTIQRAFVVTVQNAKPVAQSYRLQIVNQPFGGKATFQQLPAGAPALTTLDITVNPRSSASRSVFVTSTVKNAPVGVTVTEISAVGATPPSGASTGVAVLNPDPTSPDIGSPDIGTPDIGSSEVYTPDIGTPDIGSPDIGTPDIGSPDIGTPDIGTPDIGTPDIGTPDIGTPTYATPDIGSPDIGTPDIGSNSVTDTTWPLTNDGNTTASYSTKLLSTGTMPAGLKLQLILHQNYKTPIAHGCTLATETTHILLNNVPNPTVLTTTDGIGTPDIGSATIPTVSIVPGQIVNLTVRVVDPVHLNRHIPASSFLTPVLVAHAVNTANLKDANPQPAISLVITTPIGDAPLNSAYNVPMNAIGGVPPYRWALLDAPPDERFISGPPTGVTLNSSTATFAGTATQLGAFRFAIVVTDSVNHSATRLYTVHITNPLIAMTSLPNGVKNLPYSAKLGSTGGLAPIHWEVTSGALPAQLSLSDDGTISGTPTSVGTFPFSVLLTDSSFPSQTTTAQVQLTIVDAVKITTTTLPDGTAGLEQPYTASIDTTGGTAPFTFSVSPALERLGLTLDAVTGKITGTAFFVTDQDYTFSVTDSSNPASSDSKVLHLRITPPLRITTATIPVAIVNQPYSTTISATGGQPPYTWSVKGPTELSIDSNGLLSGTFTQPNSSFVTVTVTDAGNPRRIAVQQYAFSAATTAITAITPSTAAAGFGQLVALDVVGLTSLTNVVAKFSDASTTANGFIFGGASTPSRLLVRLPFVGDNNGTAANLTPGSITVALVNGTTTLATHAMTLSPDVPGAPTIQNMYGLTTPPEANSPCGSGLGTTPLASVSPGQGVAVSALGVDTVGSRLRFSQTGKDDSFAATTCAFSGSTIGVAPIFVVPSNLSAGPVDVSMSVTVGNFSSAWSAPVQLQVVAPTFACIGAEFNVIDTWTGGTAVNGGVAPGFTTNSQNLCLVRIENYHWNNGQGATPGKIGLTVLNAARVINVGPFDAVGSAGQNNAPNVNWTATPPAQVVINGLYGVTDTDPATWSYDASDTTNKTAFSRVVVKKAVVTTP